MVYWHIETDYVALMIYAVLFVKAFFLNREKDYTDKVFCLSLVLGFLSTIVDIFSSIMMNDLLNWWLYEISMIIYGLFAPILALFWFLYTLSLIFRDKEKSTKWSLIVFHALYAVYALIIITNPLHELYFHLSPEMEYSRGILFIPLIVWTQTLVGVVGIMILLLNWKRLQSQPTRVLLLLLHIVTVVADYVQIANPGWLIICATYAVAFMVCDATFERQRRRLLYDQLKQSYDQLQEDQKIEQAYQKQLEKAVREAKLASQAKSDFLSRMSHDIRTPLNGIQGMLEIIDKNRENEERVNDCLGKIKIASGHLLSLINDVLDMSKLESDEITFSHNSFDMRKEIRECNVITTPLAEEKGIILEFEGEGAIAHPYLLGSPMHLRQVICNILGNAIKYTNYGGFVHWGIEELPGDDAEHFCYRFTVRDTGIGISEEFLPKLFQPFAQENSGSRTHYEGTGLGLAIVKQIVDKLGGEISVESEKGVGTTFTVILSFQVDPAPVVAADDGEQKEELRLDGARLLVVEDNELNLEIAQFILEDMGASVDVAANGQEAVDIFEQAPPDTYQAILMDVMMPVMNGLDATRAIRTSERSDGAVIPIIAMTANAFNEDAEKCREAGMNAHLAKPLDTKLLLRTITAQIKKQHSG